MKVSFDSVILPTHVVEQIRAAISQENNRSLIFETWGFNEVFEKGTAISILLYGIPGTGKTMMAQAIADMYGYDLKILGSAEIETPEPGGAERAIKKAFKLAQVRLMLKRGMSDYQISEVIGEDISDDPEEYENPMTGEVTPIPPESRWHGKPQLLLFDECDSLLANRNSVGFIMAAQVNCLLSELERFEGIVMFTTNRLGLLDPAMERRLTAKIELVAPNKELREKIWKRMIPSKAPLGADVKFEELAEFPLVGGNIKNAVLNAARDAAQKGLSAITKECFVRAIDHELEGIQQFASSMEQDQRVSRQTKNDRSGFQLGQDNQITRTFTKTRNGGKNGK